MYSHLTVRAKLGFLSLDGLLLLICGVAVCVWRTSYPMEQILAAPSLYLISAVQLVLLYLLGAYDFDRNRSATEVFLIQALSFIAGLGIIVLLNYLLQKERAGLFGRGVLIGFLFSFYVLSFFYRETVRRFFSRAEDRSATLFLGGTIALEHLQAEFKKRDYQGTRHFVALADFKPDLLEKKWSAIVVGLKQEELTPEQASQLMEARFSGHQLSDLNDFYERVWRKLPIFNLEAHWFILSQGFHLLASPVSIRLKRLFDLVLSLGLLFMVWPFMLLTALAVRLESEGPALYQQQRTGLGDQIFTIYKFRSMNIDAEKNGAQWAQKSDARVTRVGRVIRLSRLDELPQLWNVFRGDMSFIGPRPERPEFNDQLEKEIPYYKLRHLVRPGITGWAQVMYPYGASVEDALEKLQYDLYYIKNYGLLLDFKILVKTVKVILFGKGR